MGQLHAAAIAFLTPYPIFALHGLPIRQIPIQERRASRADVYDVWRIDSVHVL